MGEDGSFNQNFQGEKRKKQKKHVFYFLALSWVTCHVK